jgi:outer membrane protein assembly factor BamD
MTLLYRLVRPIGFLALALSLTAGCSSTKKAATEKPLSGTDEQIFIGDTIEKNYDPNVIMKRAESFFEKEEYPEAIVEYQHFLDLHRIHTLAPYAQFRLGESHFKMVKSIDRDPDPVYKALESFEKLLKDYPGSRYESDARERIRSCHNFLAEAHLFVGKFYLRREAYLAAAHRFEAVVKQYPDIDASSEALYYLALSYHELGAEQWAKERLIELAERYPQNKHRIESQRLLAKLNGGKPIEAVAVAGLGRNGMSNGASGAVRQNGVQEQPAVALASSQSTPAATVRPAVSMATAPALTAGSRPPIPSGTTGISSNGKAPAPSYAKASVPAPASSVSASGSNGTSPICRLGEWC